MSSITIACCRRSAAVCVCFTDVDSFVCHVESDDLVGELGAIADQWLDTSNFEHAHPIYSSTNFRALGKFKSETAGLPLTGVLRLALKDVFAIDAHRRSRVSQSQESAEIIREKTRHP